MKFSDGYWHKRKGVTIASPADVRDYKITDKSVTLYVAHTKIVDRGQTLNAPMITITYTSPQPGIIAVELTHHKGGATVYPRFELENMNCDLATEKTENGLNLKSESMEVKIDFEPFNVEFYFDGKFLTSTGFRKGGYAQAPEANYMLEQLDLSVGEKIYGLGERFTPFVKNGQVVDIWNEDGGTASEQAYKNVPFYLSSENYGVLVDHAEKVSYEIGSEVVSRVQFSVKGETLRYMIIGGDSRKNVLERYTTLSGKPALPPLWSFGLWLSTSFTTSYDEETVSSFIDGMAERNLPLHVFHYDCFWMKEYEWSNFTWDEDMFPDATAMLARIKSKGLKICVWTNPYIAQKSYLFDEAMEKGYLLKRTDGSVWQWDRWQAGMGLVDFTNPDAVKWFQEKLKVLLNQGVDCFKTDFGERIPSEDVVYFDQKDPEAMHNYYTYLYNKAVFELLEEERGKGEAALFARSATVGGQKFPVHWGGDCDSEYSSMAESLRGGLSLALSGFGFWSHDISGFENTAEPDLYKRWAAFGLLSTHSRLHGSASYRVPWMFDDEAVDVVRFFTNLKCRLSPYLFSNAVMTSQTGVPTMRAMMLEFENDRACLDVDTQYMLGESIMVAPIFRKDSKAVYYLPQGTWTHFLTGETVEGGSWREEEYDYFSLPLFVRENSLVPIGSNEEEVDYDFSEDLELRLYQLKNGKTAETRVYSGKAEEILFAKAERNDSKISVELSGCKANLLLVGIDEVKSVTSGEIKKTESGIMITDINDKTEIEL